MTQRRAIRILIYLTVLGSTLTVFGSFLTFGFSSPNDASRQTYQLLDNPPPNSWRGVIPLRSTRAEVEQLLGKPKISDGALVIYDTPTERVNVVYSQGPCELTEIERWNVHATAMVTITKVIGDSGVWRVDDSTLATAIQSQLVHQPGPSVAVTFEPNATTTEADRRQIFELVVTEILQDEKKAERLLNLSRVVILRDGVTFDLPRPLRTNLIALDRNEIQKIAEQEKRVVFLNYEPLTSEGSRILATISLRDAVSPGSGPRVPYKFTFVFWCVRQNGHWVIEKSIGYAQS